MLWLHFDKMVLELKSSDLISYFSNKILILCLNVTIYSIKVINRMKSTLLAGSTAYPDLEK
jgi:hypothetical protein